MKKVLFALLATAALVSCEKDDKNEGTPSMSAKIDGNTKTYASPVATKQTTGGIELITIAGETSATDGITIEVEKNGAVTTGSYGGTTGGTLGMVAGPEYFLSGSDLVNVTITSIDASHVEGTFSGTLESISSTEVKVISEGKFYAKF